MTKEELVEKLNDIKNMTGQDEERDHVMADSALLEYINDKDVSEAYKSIDKWYA